MARYSDGDERYVGGDILTPDGGDQQIQITPDFNQVVRAAADENLTDTVTPDPLTATTNNYSMGQGTYFRLSTSGGAQIITGFANVQAGRRIFIFNVAGGANITLNNQDAGSSAENRIITGTGAAVVIQSDRGAVLFYDGISTRWRLVAFT